METEKEELRHDIQQIKENQAYEKGQKDAKREIMNYVCTVSISAALALAGVFYSAGIFIVQNYSAANAALKTFWGFHDK